MVSFQSVINEQREHFKSGKTLDLDSRIAVLNQLKTLIINNEQAILDALAKDLNKPYLEAFSTEISFVISEINHTMKNLKSWMKSTKAKTSFFFKLAKSRVEYVPLGQCLVISPWNYPFQLLMTPAIGAIAAGNTVLLKPSEMAPHTAKLVEDLINSNLNKEKVYVINGDASTTQALLKEGLDHVFFTGSTQTGQLIYEAASKTLTPVTLELGGKSPCVVDKSCNLEVSARRIAWGKFLNNGQTCVAPDYLIIHEDIKDQFIELLKKNIENFYGKDEIKSSDYGRIINLKHFKRLEKLLENQTPLFGGKCVEKSLFISPTLIETEDMDSPLMSEEIFGPILPILSFKHNTEVIKIIEKNPNPLAFYLFSEDKIQRDLFLKLIPFGGGCINDCIIHLSSHELPFGGVRQSGIGNYHGKFSFERFSHKKSLLLNNTHFDPMFRYPPYAGKLEWFKKSFRLK